MHIYIQLCIHRSIYVMSLVRYIKMVLYIVFKALSSWKWSQRYTKVEALQGKTTDGMGFETQVRLEQVQLRGGSCKLLEHCEVGPGQSGSRME